MGGESASGEVRGMVAVLGGGFSSPAGLRDVFGDLQLLIAGDQIRGKRKLRMGVTIGRRLCQPSARQVKAFIRRIGPEQVVVEAIGGLAISVFRGHGQPMLAFLAGGRVLDK